VVGAGNVGLIVGFQMLQAGAEVVAVVEAGERVGGYEVHAAKLQRHGVPILLRHAVTGAVGDGEVEGAIIAQVDDALRVVAGSERRVDVDLIAIAVGLSPLAELAWMAGCRFGHFAPLGGFVPLHGERMRTTAPRLWVAGDIAGIEEASTAMEEGRLAGIGMAAALGRLSRREAAGRAAAVAQRLDALRMGPFGADRMQAKQALLEQFRRHVKDANRVA
jgi:thioredoxin reductase